MARGAAARRYAKALFELARDADRVEAVRGELEALHDLLEESAELRDVLLQPLYPSAQRRAVLAAVAEKMEASQLLKSFYSFLIDQRRLVDLEAIGAAYARLADAAAGVRRAEVVSAAPLRDEQKERLRRALAARAGHDLDLEARVDPELLGGVVAKIGDLVLDGSLRTQLANLRATLTEA